MKFIYAGLLFFFSFFNYAQNETLHFNEILAIDNIELELISVVDSRCPKNVNCITAGQAKVVIEVFKNGEFLKQETLTIYPTGINEKSATLFASNDLVISGFNLLPYPQTPNDINEGAYFLELVIEN